MWVLQFKSGQISLCPLRTQVKRPAVCTDGKVIDEVVQPLGVRKYEIVAGKGFFLNGEKYPMYGVTRHQDW